MYDDTAFYKQRPKLVYGEKDEYANFFQKLFEILATMSLINSIAHRKPFIHEKAAKREAFAWQLIASECF